MTNHLDVVERLKAASPADTFQSPEGMLAFVLRVIAALPPEERIGLVKAPAGGENVCFYAPADTFVRVNRVVYPDGQLVKILTDSGVGGVNGPAWNDDGIRPDLYLSISGDAPAPTPTPTPEPVIDLSEVLKKLDELAKSNKDLLDAFRASNAEQTATIVAGLQQVVDLITMVLNKPIEVTSPPVVFPAYTCRFGMNMRAVPEIKP